MESGAALGRAPLEAVLARLETKTDEQGDTSDEVRRIRRELTNLIRKIYTNLTAWDTVLVSRHRSLREVGHSSASGMNRSRSFFLARRRNASSASDQRRGSASATDLDPADDETSSAARTHGRDVRPTRAAGTSSSR